MEKRAISVAACGGEQGQLEGGRVRVAAKLPRRPSAPRTSRRTADARARARRARRRRGGKRSVWPSLHAFAWLTRRATLPRNARRRRQRSHLRLRGHQRHQILPTTQPPHRPTAGDARTVEHDRASARMRHPPQRPHAAPGRLLPNRRRRLRTSAPPQSGGRRTARICRVDRSRRKPANAYVS
jgi:hypothetical protein